MHGVQWVAHCLHDCTHAAFAGPRQKILESAQALIDGFCGLDVVLMSAADFPEQEDQDGGSFYIDLCGFFAENSRVQSRAFGISAEVLVKWFNSVRVHLTTLFVGADGGVERALSRHQQLLRPRT